jgi:hypothetical protein
MRTADRIKKFHGLAVTLASLSHHDTVVVAAVAAVTAGEAVVSGASVVNM